jgi:P27 family predicted phage terminase small subunit
MGKRGPKAKTAANSRRRRPTGSGLWEGFAPPESLTPAALAEYHRLVANLRRVGTLDATDPQLVVAAARIKGLMDDAFEAVAVEGLTLEGGHGSLNAHPMLGVINSLTLRLRGLYSDMGLTAPSSKHGKPTEAEGQGDGDGWGDLLAVRG